MVIALAWFARITGVLLCRFAEGERAAREGLRSAQANNIGLELQSIPLASVEEPKSPLPCSQWQGDFGD